MVLAGSGLAALFAPTEATAQFRLPFRLPVDVDLTKPLGFRVAAGLTAAPVLANRTYLQPPTRLKLTGVQGTFGTARCLLCSRVPRKKGFIRCDDASAMTFVPAAPATPPGSPPPTPPTPPPASAPVSGFCNGKEPCRNFCLDNCTFDAKTEWARGARCAYPQSLMSTAGDPPSSALSPIPALTFVKAEAGTRATAADIDSLRKADSCIQSHPGALPPDHVVMVDNCCRSTEANSTKACGFIMKGNHLQQKWKTKIPMNAQEEATKQKELASAEEYLDPKANKGLSWPGPGQHTRGNACDIKIAKVGGIAARPDYDDLTECRADTRDPKNRELSRKLDEIMTNPSVGAVRLNCEMWHFEFGLTGAATTNCRCVAPACADKHRPPLCKGPSGC